jgi:hypothetical protein
MKKLFMILLMMCPMTLLSFGQQNIKNDTFKIKIAVARYNGNIIAIGENNPFAIDITSFFIDPSSISKEDSKILVNNYDWEMYGSSGKLSKNIIVEEEKCKLTDGNTLIFKIETIEIKN